MADAFKPSKKDQVSLGKRAATEVRKQEKIVPESDQRVQMMRSVAAKLFAADPTPKGDPWEFSFDMIDKKELNAFAFPGGPIFFFAGLVDKFETEDQLAGVLAHEITHVRKEHWAYAYADQQKRAAGLSLLLILIRANRTVSDLASISNDLLLTLPFSRKHETESDDRGFEMMIKAGYNPQGMVDSFTVLKGGGKSQKGMEWLSTHPDIDKRIARLNDKISKSSTRYPAQKKLPWK